MCALSCIRGNNVFDLELVVLLQPRLVCFTSLMASHFYVVQDIRQMSREQERATVYSPVCKAKGAPARRKSDV